MPFGIGRWLQRNAGTLGTVVGGAAGLALGNPMLGAVIGGGLGGAVQSTGGGRLPGATLPSAGLATDAFARMSSPTYMLPSFERLARASTPTLDTYLGAQAASGGSAAIAREQMEADQQRARAAAFDAFQGFRAQADRGALGALGMGLDAERYAVDAKLDDYFARMANRQAIGSQFLSGAAGLLGYLYGPGRQQPAGTRPNPYDPFIIRDLGPTGGAFGTLGGGRLSYG